MSPLPIVERELRVASRRSGTYWIRFFLVLALFVLWMVMLLMVPNIAAVSRGKLVFICIACILFLFALLAGVFFTADCLSEEKREGTLGLLFLTDLAGYDVVFGKLIATSLHAFYGLLATLPLLAYSILLGGVTPGELVRVIAALILTLLFSLSTGMLISSHCNESRQAMGVSLLILVTCSAGLALISGITGATLRSHGASILSWPSPITLFAHAFDGVYHSRGGMTSYWGSLVVIGGMTVTALLLAGRKVGIVWRHCQEQKERPEGPGWVAGLGGTRVSAAQRSRLERAPFLWLATRDRLPGIQAWVVIGALCFLAVSAVAGAFSSNSRINFFAFFFALATTYGCHQALKWFIALEASRRLSEDRRSGALELLLVTPIDIEEIVTGQRQAMAVNFRGPLLAAAALNLLLLFVAGINPLNFTRQQTILLCELCVGGVAMLILDFYALSWVGMWMALVARKHQRAVLGTLARVVIIPWAAVFFLGLLTMGGVPIDPDVMVVLCVGWFGFAGMIEATFISRAKIGLTEAMRKISSDPTISSLDLPPYEAGTQTA